MPKVTPKYKPSVLIILDGWGVAPDSPGNAIAKAKTPNMTKYVGSYPTAVVSSFGDAVGLSWGEMGNSEVGHLNIGAGFVFYQNLPRINKEISSGEFFTNEILLKAVEHVKKYKSKFHLMGLVSNGGVHGHIEHLFALLQFCKDQGLSEVYLHAFLDGRDAVFNSGRVFINDAIKKAEAFGIKLIIATMSGRYFAMDRDNRWDRVGQAYDAIVHGQSEHMSDQPPVEVLEQSYENKVFDEEFPPTVFTENNKPLGIVEDKDSVIFFNFRSDRSREMTKAIVVPHFDKVAHKKEMPNLFFATMVQYEDGLPCDVLYPPIKVVMPLAKVISDVGLTQYHIAETEKYAHVTFFINGGQEVQFAGEERKMIASPKVSSYDQAPEMKAKEIADDVIKQIQAEKFDFYIINFANPDMVAHTGNLKASIKANETVDKHVGRIVESVLAHNGLVCITADHGNTEELLNLQTDAIDKEHSTYPVPFIIIANDLEGKSLGFPEGAGTDLSLVPASGILADVAPTILKLMGVEIPPEMTGTPLV